MGEIPLKEIAECPWPTDVWPLTLDGIPALVPDEDARTAVSGALCRFGWTLAMEEVQKVIDRSGFDLSPCGDCGETVICIPDGLPMCERCACGAAQPTTEGER